MHVGKRGRGIKFGGVIRVHVHVVLVGGCVLCYVCTVYIAAILVQDNVVSDD